MQEARHQEAIPLKQTTTPDPHVHFLQLLVHGLHVLVIPDQLHDHGPVRQVEQLGVLCV